MSLSAALRLFPRFFQRRRRFLYIQNIVGYLKRPSNRFAESLQSGYIIRCSARAQRSRRH